MIKSKEPGNDGIYTEQRVRQDNNGQLGNVSWLALYTCDADGEITSFNKAAEALWGGPPPSGNSSRCNFLNPDGSLMKPEDSPMLRTLRNGITIEGEPLIFLQEDGTKLYLHAYTQPVFNSANKLVSVISLLLTTGQNSNAELKQAMLAAIVDSSEDAIISKTLQGKITSWNRSAELLFGYSEGEALGRNITMLIPPSRLSEEEMIIYEISHGNKIDHFETVRVDKYGNEIPISLSISPIKDSHGNITGASKIARDISAIKNNEKKQAMLAAIVDASDDAIVSKTLQGIITSWNPAAERMFGYKESEIIGKHISILIPAARLSEEDMIISQIKSGNKVNHFETVRVTRDGREIYISLSVSPIKDSSGSIIGASKIARDITALKSGEEKQAMLAAIVDSSDDAIVSKTLQGIIMSWNRAAEKMFGYSAKEVVGKHISILIPPENIGEEEIIIGNIISGRKIDHFETVRCTKDGRRIPVSLSVSPIMNARGDIIGASKIARDISEQIQARDEANLYTARLEIINAVIKTVAAEMDLQKIGEKVIDLTGGILHAESAAFFYNSNEAGNGSQTVHAQWGASTRLFEKLGMPSAIIREDDFTQHQLYKQNYYQHDAIDDDLPITSLLAVPIISRAGVVVGGLYFGHSKPAMFNEEHEHIVISIANQSSIGLDNAKLYGEIRTLNSKKDEFIGLASHELKTPITSLTGYLQIVDRGLPHGEVNKTYLQKALRQIKRLSDLISDLLDVSKIETGKLPLTITRFDIVFLAEEVIELMQHSTKTHRIELNKDCDHLMVSADRQRMEQVVINLISNAIKYSATADLVKVNLATSANKVIISVQDFGLGIKKEQQDLVFSRFYRVQELEDHISGLGIGLYISKEIMNRHNGRLWVDSELGKGSVFSLELPL
jgi:PAS domain S-box-containing protein